MQNACVCTFVLFRRNNDSEAIQVMTCMCWGCAVNIGDALMRWSDDKLKSNYHRVRMPLPGEDKGSRFSIAYFNQVQDAFISSRC